MGWSEEDERQEQIILGRIETATRHMRDRAGDETGGGGMIDWNKRQADMVHQLCRDAPVMKRLLREALEHSKQFGDLTAKEIAWRAEYIESLPDVYQLRTHATRLRAALHALHWTQRGLAAILGQDERRVRRWLAGTYETPGDVLEWLERLAGFHMDNPPPRRDGAKG